MKLPHPELAVVEIAKLRDYCLNPQHIEGKFKASVFLAALGITASEADLLKQWLLAAAANDDVMLGRLDQFGQRFVLDFIASYRSRSTRIRSAWMVRTGEDFPRLVTCFVLQ